MAWTRLFRDADEMDDIRRKRRLFLDSFFSSLLSIDCSKLFERELLVKGGDLTSLRLRLDVDRQLPTEGGLGKLAWAASDFDGGLEGLASGNASMCGDFAVGPCGGDAL